MKKVKVDEAVLNEFLKLVQQHYPDEKLDTLNQVLQYLQQNWETITAPKNDEELQLYKDKIHLLEQELSKKEKEIEEQNITIEGIRNQDPKILVTKMKIEWEREKLEKEQKLTETKLELKRFEVNQKSAIEAFKQLCKKDKLPENVCTGEMGEFIRKSIGLDELLEEQGVD